GPRSTGSRPVTARICALTASRAPSAETSNEAPDSTAAPTAITAPATITRRLKPVAAVTVDGSGTRGKPPGGTIPPADAAANLRPLVTDLGPSAPPRGAGQNASIALLAGPIAGPCRPKTSPRSCA